MRTVTSNSTHIAQVSILSDEKKWTRSTLYWFYVQNDFHKINVSIYIHLLLRKKSLCKAKGICQNGQPETQQKLPKMLQNKDEFPGLMYSIYVVAKKVRWLRPDKGQTNLNNSLKLPSKFWKPADLVQKVWKFRRFCPRCPESSENRELHTRIPHATLFTLNV